MLPAKMEPSRLIVVHHSMAIVICESLALDLTEMCLAKPKLLHKLKVVEVL